MSSIGVIGGADGPTAIFMASPFPLALVGVGVLVVVAAVAVFLVAKNRKNHD